MKTLLYIGLTLLGAVATAQNPGLFNRKMIPLEADKSEKTFAKRYRITSATACNCDNAAIYIDAKNKKFYSFNYCDELGKKSKLGETSIFAIKSISQKGKQTVLKLAYKGNTATLVFMAHDGILYDLEISGENTEHFAGGLQSVFTSVENASKFPHPDCKPTLPVIKKKPER